jgi:predicted outer membrane repeat protein
MESIKNYNKIIFIPLILAGITLMFMCSVNPVAAEQSQIYVNPSGNDNYNGEYAVWVRGDDGPKQTIKNAVGTVDTGGTVKLADGTYNEHDITISRNVQIQGVSQHRSVIDGKNLGRIFYINPGINLKLSNLSIIRGKPSKSSRSVDYGGAIFNDNGNLNLESTTFNSNTAKNGGAISNHGRLTINNSIFTHNVAEKGGAIYSLGSNLNIAYSTFNDNLATGYGGAIAIHNTGIINISNCNFSRNKATNRDGGGAIANFYGTTTITNSNFYSNIAAVGGAILNYSANLVLIKDYFSGNKASNAGAVRNYKGNITVKDSTFQGNESSNAYSNNTVLSSGGAGIYNDNTQFAVSSTNIYVLRCKFIGNIARSGTGGALKNGHGTLNVVDSYFINNGAPVAAGILNYDGILKSTNNSFVGNKASADGGGAAIYNFRRSAALIKNTFKYNTAPKGGAINNYYGSMSLISCSLYRNSASTGGGIYTYGSSLSISGSKFISNRATTGGAITAILSTMKQSSNTFTNNYAKAKGGTIYNVRSTLAISKSNLNSNQALNGGAIYNHYGKLYATSNTFKNNAASPYGGALYNYFGTVSFKANYLAGNGRYGVYNVHGTIST